jgi:excisionase family DNA binding protein
MPIPATDGPYLTIQEAAERLGVSRRTVGVYFDNGLLDGYQMPESGFRRVTEASVDRMLKERGKSHA